MTVLSPEAEKALVFLSKTINETKDAVDNAIRENSVEATNKIINPATEMRIAMVGLTNEMIKITTGNEGMKNNEQ